MTQNTGSASPKWRKRFWTGRLQRHGDRKKSSDSFQWGDVLWPEWSYESRRVFISHS